MRPLLCLALLTGLTIPASGGAFGQGGGSLPDLLVSPVDMTAVTGDWQTLQISGSASADLFNVGNAPTGGPFAVVFFEDSHPTGQYEAGLDQILGSTVVAALDPNDVVNVAVAVSATILFRDNLIFAFVDSDQVIAESDEGNNISSSGAACLVTPPPGAFNPVIEWAWNHSNVEPGALNVMMSPAVIDLDLDTIPDVVFGATASRGGGLVEVGYLRALRGSDGSELFTVTDPSLRVNTSSSVAVGDIDLDGFPEIIACDTSGARLIAFEHDGTFKWRSPTLEAIYWGAPAIADLDADGAPEIIIGRQVLNNDGTLRWTGTGGRGAQSSVGPISAVADLNMDGSPDVVAGNTAYSSNGAILWQAPVPDGTPGVANFDADPFPEIVLVSGGAVRLLNHDGSVAWGPVYIPGGGAGGPPTIADYDGDGEPEIGVAGAARYVVFETHGSVRWAVPTQDHSSNRTGSSVFDFDGDGQAEVVYSDEIFLRIYRGTDGAELFRTPMSSCTWHEYPLVADVDADGNAEIVAVANDSCGLGSQRGIFVFGDAGDNWVSTRAIWNQHTYHITNINDDGTIPMVENDNWLFPAAQPLNNYRQNLIAGLAPNAAPDLTSSFIRCSSVPTESYVTVRVGNGGGVIRGAGLPVSFYDGDPDLGGLLLGTTFTTTGIQPGEFEDVSLPLGPGFDFTTEIYAVVDDLGGLLGIENECDEANNIHSAAGIVCAGPLEVSKIPDPPEVPEIGADVTYTVTATNIWPEMVILDMAMDDVFGDIGGACNPPLPAGLPTGDSMTCTFTRHVSGTVGAPHVNVAHITGEDVAGNPVEGSAEATVGFRREGPYPPVADAGPDQVLECAGPLTPTVMDGSGSFDPDGDPITYQWTGPFPEGGGMAVGISPAVSFGFGGSTVQLIVNDGMSDSLPDQVQIEVEDTTPPSISARLVPLFVNDDEGPPGGWSCIDEIDNDRDGLVDVADPDCQFDVDREGEPGSEECYDETDNDRDGRMDQNDPDCHEPQMDPEVKRYRVQVSSQDRCDGSSTSHAIITLPCGSIPVSSGLIVRLEKDAGNCLWQMSPGYLEVRAPSFVLDAWAEDEVGNRVDVQVTPGSAPTKIRRDQGPGGGGKRKRMRDRVPEVRGRS